MKSRILDKVVDKTKAFLERVPKNRRKKKGQFFTSIETAEYMAGMFDLSGLPEEVRILDPGTGSGILSAAVVDRLNDFVFSAEKTAGGNSPGPIRSIKLTCYETDDEIQPLLEENLECIRKISVIPVEYELIKKHYILAQGDAFERAVMQGGETAEDVSSKYDMVVSNPPYLRIPRNDPSAQAMPTVVHGAPNLYFLFAAMSLFHLKPGAEMVYIIPRSWTSGLYFAYFRKYLLSRGKLEHIHLFGSRDKVFKEEEVLQETMIIKVKKATDKPDHVQITSSQSTSDFLNISSVMVPYSSVVAGKDKYVFLPINTDQIHVISKIHLFQKTMPEEGIRMRTGIVVDFRQWEELRKTPGDHVVPLFYSQHIRDGRVHHRPSGKEYDWIADEKPGLVQKNKNYVFCKRFTAKEERRRLQCGIYLAEDFGKYSLIGTQNKINYVDSMDGSDMDLPTTYGVYALLNSTLFDTYYRILNGSTQVNSTEINSIPVPPMETIREIGRKLLKTGDLTTANCDSVLSEVAYG